jgi:general secretion pathway protein I
MIFTVGQVSNLSNKKRQVGNLSYHRGLAPCATAGLPSSARSTDGRAIRGARAFAGRIEAEPREQRVPRQSLGTRKLRGFTLLEVMLALAILAGALAVLGEFARMGLHSAKTARDLTRAELLCESIMSEITAGITPPDTVDRAPVIDPVTGSPLEETQTDDAAPWVYSIDAQSIDADGLLAVTVTVTQDLPPAQRPASFSLVRWMPDPMLDLLYGSTETESSSTPSTGTETPSP